MTMYEEKRKIPWVNGLKGVACLIVFAHHFANSFFPSTFSGLASESRTVSGFDTTFAFKPYGILLNGNFAVTLFVVLSAFLFAGKAMENTLLEMKQDVFKTCTRRYLTLMLNTAVVSYFYYFLSWILTKLNLNYMNYFPGAKLKSFPVHILFLQWVTEDSSIVGPLWTMKIFLIGSFIALFLGMWSSKNRWYMPFVYFVIAFPLGYLYPYYFAVMMGVTLADLYFFDRVEQYRKFLLN